MKVNVIFLCRDIKIISNTFMDISMCSPFAVAFHAVSILRGVLRAKVWENILYRGCCLFISKYLLIFMRLSLLLSQHRTTHQSKSFESITTGRSNAIKPSNIFEMKRMADDIKNIIMCLWLHKNKTNRHC